MGLRPNGFAIVVRTWASGAVGKGTFTDSTLPIAPNPKMREVSTRELASSGGVYEQGDLLVGPFTPAYDGPPPGGYTPAQLDPPLSPADRGVEVIYVVIGPDAGQYRRITATRDRAMRYMLVLRRVNVARPAAP